MSDPRRQGNEPGRLPLANLDRRQLLVAAAALAATPAVAGAESHEHEGHHGHAGHGEGRYASVARAALDCVGTGNACTEHCLVEFKKGNSELAACAAAVEELVAACQALAKLAAQQSRHLPHFAAVCADICRSCEDECRKHEDEHPPCKACAEACAACIEECEKVKAA